MTELHAGRQMVDRDTEPPMIIDQRYLPLATKFFGMFARSRTSGGALAVFQHGRPVLDIWAGSAEPGRPWSRDTMVMSYSTGKGVAATVIHRLADRGLIDYDRPVADYWPEFAAAGKESITVRELLNHRAGLHRVRGLVSDDEFLDHRVVAAALAASPADRRRHHAQGYHAVSFGTLVAELAQRVTGLPYDEILRAEVSEPLGVGDFWFRVPQEHRTRIAPLHPEIRLAGIDFESYASRAGRFRRLSGLIESLPPGMPQWQNDPAVHDALHPSWNGVFTARALATMYAALANNGVIHGRQYLAASTVEQIAQMPFNSRRDYVLGVVPQHWMGYHRAVLGKRSAAHGFGHYGTGGSGAVAYPELGLSLAFVTNRLGSRLTPVADARLVGLKSVACRLAAQN